MNKIIKNIQNNLNIQNYLNNFIKLKFNKIQILFILIIFFSLVYMLLDDKHFEGVNKFKELVKEEVIKDEVQKKIKENFESDKEERKERKEKGWEEKGWEEKGWEEKGWEEKGWEEKGREETHINEKNKEEVIDDVTKEAEKNTKNEELAAEKVEPSFINKYLNRLYFAIVTGCLLGYGDIYPVSNISKILSGLQGLLTVSLIIY